MTERVIHKTASGSVVAYRESDDERRRRIEREAAAAAQALRITRGQRKALTVRRRTDKAPA